MTTSRPADPPVFSFEVLWTDARGARRSAKAIGFNSPVKASVMAKALATEMGWNGEKQ